MTVKLSALFGAFSLVAHAATAEDDSTCLMQNSMTRASLQTAVSDSGGAVPKQGKHGSPTDKQMLQRVQTVVDRAMATGTDPSPEEQAMVDTVASMIEDISIPALLAGRDENQRQVDRMGTVAGTCEAMRGNADAEPGGVAQRWLLVENARAAHRGCRAGEADLETELNSRCGNFWDYAEGLQPPSGLLPEPAPSPATEDFLRTNEEWFRTRYAQYTDHKAQCDTAVELHSAMQDQCARDQTSFEAASCALPAAQHGMCEPYNICRDEADAEWLATWEDVRAIEEQRKLEYVTLKKIKCLILTIAESDAEARSAAIATCSVADLTIRYDGSVSDPGILNITYGEVVPRVFCANEVALPLPCGPDFLAAEYAAPALPELAPAAPCIPCIGVLAPTTGAPLPVAVAPLAGIAAQYGQASPVVQAAQAAAATQAASALAAAEQFAAGQAAATAQAAPVVPAALTAPQVAVIPPTVLPGTVVSAGVAAPAQESAAQAAAVVAQAAGARAAAEQAAAQQAVAAQVAAAAQTAPVVPAEVTAPAVVAAQAAGVPPAAQAAAVAQAAGVAAGQAAAAAQAAPVVPAAVTAPAVAVIPPTFLPGTFVPAAVAAPAQGAAAQAAAAVAQAAGARAAAEQAAAQQAVAAQAAAAAQTAPVVPAEVTAPAVAAAQAAGVSPAAQAAAVAQAAGVAAGQTAAAAQAAAVVPAAVMAPVVPAAVTAPVVPAAVTAPVVVAAAVTAPVVPAVVTAPVVPAAVTAPVVPAAVTAPIVPAAVTAPAVSEAAVPAEEVF